MKRNYHLILGVSGTLMGLVLGLSGFADFTQVHNMFTFSDLTLLYAFAGAVVLCVLGFFVLVRKDLGKKKFNGGTVPGGVMFGVGWAITGACPSIALVQVGQGQLAALLTLTGIFMGVWVYRNMVAGTMQLDSGVCGEE